MSRSRSVGDRLKVLAIALLTATVLLSAYSVISTTEFAPGELIASGEVTASDGTLYLDRAGHPTAVGEIDNDRREAISNVTVTVRFFENETVVGEVEKTPPVDPLPGQTATPFSARLPNTDVDPDRFEVDVTYDSDGATPTGSVTVADHEVSSTSSDSVTIVGEVTNEGVDSARSMIVVTFYDAEGTVVGYRTSRTSPDSVPADGTGDFRVRYATLGDVPSLARTYDSYRIVVTEI